MSEIIAVTTEAAIPDFAIEEYNSYSRQADEEEQVYVAKQKLHKREDVKKAWKTQFAKRKCKRTAQSFNDSEKRKLIVSKIQRCARNYKQVTLLRSHSAWTS